MRMQLDKEDVIRLFTSRVRGKLDDAAGDHARELDDAKPTRLFPFLAELREDGGVLSDVAGGVILQQVGPFLV